MKVSSLLKKIADQVSTATSFTKSVYLHSSELGLDSLTKPFAVVRSNIHDEKVISFSDQTREYNYQVWVYVFPPANEYKALDLPVEAAATLRSEFTVTEGTGDNKKSYSMKILNLTIERLNGDEDDLERYGSVIAFTVRVYK